VEKLYPPVATHVVALGQLTVHDSLGVDETMFGTDQVQTPPDNEATTYTASSCELDPTATHDVAEVQLTLPSSLAPDPPEETSAGVDHVHVPFANTPLVVMAPPLSFEPTATHDVAEGQSTLSNPPLPNDVGVVQDHADAEYAASDTRVVESLKAPTATQAVVEGQLTEEASPWGPPDAIAASVDHDHTPADSVPVENVGMALLSEPTAMHDVALAQLTAAKVVAPAVSGVMSPVKDGRLDEGEITPVGSDCSPVP
jgi:hypothetical protein